MQIPWVYHNDYDIPLPKNHRFSSSKFGDLYTLLKKIDLYHNAKIYEPFPATEKQLLRVHTKEYIDKIKYGNLTDSEEKKLGLPWSNTLSNRSFLAVNGTFLTVKLALSNGIACHLAGGTHHAYSNYGSGFCVFNDIAFAAKNLLCENICQKILVIDCDVHQGDGTANICNNNMNIYTCSIHARNNFPYTKAESDLDIELPDDISEDEYLREIDKMLDGLNYLSNSVLEVSDSITPISTMNATSALLADNIQKMINQSQLNIINTLGNKKRVKTK